MAGILWVTGTRRTAVAVVSLQLRKRLNRAPKFVLLQETSCSGYLLKARHSLRSAWLTARLALSHFRMTGASPLTEALLEYMTKEPL